LGVVAALLAISASSGGAWAQATGSFNVTAKAGVGIPGGDLWLIQDPGFHTGGAIAFYFTPNFAIRGEVTASLLNSIEDSFGNVPSPDMDLIHFGGGFEVNFSSWDWQRFPMTFVASLGAGATSVKAQESFSNGSSVDFSSTVFTANGAGEVGWQFNDSVNAFVSFQAYAMWFDEEETAVFADRSPEIEPFDLAWEFPVSLGVRISVQ
jgi:hypothetical protein